MNRSNFESVVKAAIRCDKYEATRETTFASVMAAWDHLDQQRENAINLVVKKNRELEANELEIGTLQQAVGEAGAEIVRLRQELALTPKPDPDMKPVGKMSKADIDEWFAALKREGYVSE